MLQEYRSDHRPHDRLRCATARDEQYEILLFNRGQGRSSRSARRLSDRARSSSGPASPGTRSIHFFCIRSTAKLVLLVMTRCLRRTVVSCSLVSCRRRVCPRRIPLHFASAIPPCTEDLRATSIRMPSSRQSTLNIGCPPTEKFLSIRALNRLPWSSVTRKRNWIAPFPSYCEPIQIHRRQHVSAPVGARFRTAPYRP
jgi:hypothetical protein